MLRRAQSGSRRPSVLVPLGTERALLFLPWVLAACAPPLATPRTPGSAPDEHVDLELGAPEVGDRWLYRLSVEVEGGEEGAWIPPSEDEVIAVERVARDQWRVRGRCGWLGGEFDQPGCVRLLFVQGEGLSSVERRVEHDWRDGAFVSLRDDVMVSPVSDGIVLVRARRTLRMLSFIGAEGTFEGRYDTRAGRYDEVVQRLRVIVVSLNPTSATSRSEQTVTLRLRYDPGAEPPPRVAEPAAPPELPACGDVQSDVESPAEAPSIEGTLTCSDVIVRGFCRGDDCSGAHFFELSLESGPSSRPLAWRFSEDAEPTRRCDTHGEQAICPLDAHRDVRVPCGGRVRLTLEPVPSQEAEREEALRGSWIVRAGCRRVRRRDARALW